MMFEITDEWLARFSTKGFGWTAKQLRFIGIRYPLQAGWRQSVVGKQISEEQKAGFESPESKARSKKRRNHKKQRTKP